MQAAATSRAVATRGVVATDGAVATDGIVAIGGIVAAVRAGRTGRALAESLGSAVGTLVGAPGLKASQPLGFDRS
jgi:hypothetical protein